MDKHDAEGFLFPEVETSTAINFRTIDTLVRPFTLIIYSYVCVSENYNGSNGLTKRKCKDWVLYLFSASM